MSVKRLNDAPILDQLDGLWEKLVLALLWKYHPGETLRITAEDLKELRRASEAGSAVLFTHGHADPIELAVITAERAALLAAHDRTQRGNA